MSRKVLLTEFTAFYLAYRPKLVALVTRLLGGRKDEIEDVLQDAWIKGARAWPPREPAHARAWLGRIAINEALTLRRRDKRSPVAIALRDGVLPEDRPDAGLASDDLAAHGEIRRAIDGLQSRIPGQIAVLRLVCLEGRTYREAAIALGIAEGTAKSQTFKAIAHLRSTLTAPKAA